MRGQRPAHQPAIPTGGQQAEAFTKPSLGQPQIDDGEGDLAQRRNIVSGLAAHCKAPLCGPGTTMVDQWCCDCATFLDGAHEMNGLCVGSALMSGPSSSADCSTVRTSAGSRGMISRTVSSYSQTSSPISRPCSSY